MKKTVITLSIVAALVLSLAGCGLARPAVSQTPAVAEQNVSGETAEVQIEPAATPAPAPAAVRQDGERFEEVIILEGMEETVHYEHVRNEALGLEMDYDYESFVRHSEPDREWFVSVWDDPNHPENYLEVTADTGNAELVASAVGAALSNQYELYTETFQLNRAGSCIYIEASEEKGGGTMAPMLQSVYVIPAADGCRIATAHYAIEGAEGFGRRFNYMVNTLTVLDREMGSTVSDEMALSAIRQYCIESNPDLEGILNAGEYPVYWEITSSDESQVVVLYRSYTGAETRYYIDRTTGAARVTEFVPGITPGEMQSEESVNVWDYMG